MAKVEGPNGVVIDVAGSVASGLVGDGHRGYSYVQEEKPEPEIKAAVPKRKTRKGE